MIIEHKMNTAFYLCLPMVDASTPALYKTGLSPLDTAYYKDGVGAWTSLDITDTFTEIGSTGVYALDLTAAELNHDMVFIKVTAAGAADTTIVFRMNSSTVWDDLLADHEEAGSFGWLLKKLQARVVNLTEFNRITGHVIDYAVDGETIINEFDTILVGGLEKRIPV